MSRAGEGTGQPNSAHGSTRADPYVGALEGRVCSGSCVLAHAYVGWAGAGMHVPHV